MSFKMIYSSAHDSQVNLQPYCDKPNCQPFPDESDKNEDQRCIIFHSTEKTGPFAEYSPRFDSIRVLAGAWDSHRFEKELWPDKQFVKIDANRIPVHSADSDEEIGETDEYEEETIQTDILTDDMIAASLNYLERSPINLKYVLCKCDLSDKELSDITAIKYYHYIQYLDVSKNGLTSLAALGQLPFLQYLDASCNYLEKALDFKAPLYLTFVNLRFNSIKFIPDLTEFWSITNLDLSHNDIEKIEGLENLRYLTHLDLSFNKIMALENLNNMRIQYLYLHHNHIDNGIVEEDPVQFKTMEYIRGVDLSNNNISSLEMFQNAENIEFIDMANNYISHLMELYYLRNLRYLSRLNLKNNTITTMKYYVNVCMDNIKSLVFLDEKEIPAEKRLGVKTDYSSIDTGTPYPELILLQQINFPEIEPHVVPVNYPLPIIIILVGPPGSKKKQMVRKFCKAVRTLAIGVSHTTRPKTENETDGEDYFFVSAEEFKNLVRTGKFMAVSEFNGHSYGIANEEVYKTTDGTVVFHSDINAALSMKMRGANPKLVLAMPRSENVHLKWLKDKYLYSETDHHIIRVKESSSIQVRIGHSPVYHNKISEFVFKNDTTQQTFSVKSIDTAYCSITDSVGPVDKHTQDSKKVSFSGPSSGAHSNLDSKVEMLDSFFKMVIESRQKLLDVHFAHPGLFNNTIFTDEVRSSLRKLKSVLRDSIDLSSFCQPSSVVENDETYERIVGIRLSSLDLQGFSKLIKEDIPPHCECDAKYIERHF